MSNSIQGIRNIFDIVRTARRNGQPMTEKEIQDFLLRIVSDEKIRQRYHNFEQGYAAEELFRRIYSLLPWVKVIVPLGQEQYPEESKEEIQIPDYIITFEAGSKDSFDKILIEAKLIADDKRTFTLPKYKYDVLKKYEDNMNIPLLFAVFWRKKMIWTVNSIESFSEKSSQYKLGFEQAYKNDLSSIFGDYTYIFDKKIFRKSIFSKLNNVESNYAHYHDKYGKPIYEGISLDENDYIQLKSIETPFLDCAFDFVEINKTEITENEILLMEQLNSVTYRYKLSSLLLGYLTKIYCYDNDDMYYEENIVVKNAFHIVDSMRQRCGGRIYYVLPYDKTNMVNYLMKLQFGTTHIYDTYRNNNNTDMLLCSHDI